ncbi:MAG: hypothetical protein JST59_29500 [Actinobacteria bacterium]|nr:hypothetical protein [Actinomycetota bacterium]
MAEKAPTRRQQTDVDLRVQVAYTVPVEVIVDLREGTVDRVVIIDEGVALDQVEGAREETTLRPIQSEVASRATQIAEESVDWPRWEFGF